MSLHTRRWLAPLVLIGVGGTILSLQLHERPEALCADGFVLDAEGHRCTLRLRLPNAEKLEINCDEFGQHGELSFSWPRLSDTRYGCPTGFERALEEKTARCTFRLESVDRSADCSELASGSLHYTLGPSP